MSIWARIFYSNRAVYIHLNDENFKLEERSLQLKELQSKQSRSPYFHIYYLPKYDKTSSQYLEVDVNKLRQLIAKCIFEEIRDELFAKKRLKSKKNS